MKHAVPYAMSYTVLAYRKEQGAGSDGILGHL